MITVKDIARRAGVSLGTVDRVLHNRGKVAPDTEARVREAIHELSYTPNVHARNLSHGRVFVIEVLIPHLQSDGGYWAEPYRGMQRAFARLNMNNLEVRTSFFNRYNEQSFVDCLDSIFNVGGDAPAPDGLLVAPVVSVESQRVLAERIAQRNIASVAFDSRLHGTDIPFVGQDPRQGGRVAGRLAKLMRDGGSSVASVTLGRVDLHLLERANAFREYWAEISSGDIYDLSLLDGSEEEYRDELVTRLQEIGADLGAVFMTNASADLLAQALAIIGIRRHIPIIGYDLLAQNAQLLREGRIDAIISQRPETQGYEAAHMLARHLAFGTDMDAEVLMPVEIVLPENMDSFQSE
ncbi:MAG: LacI family DNA-binding transcriptional regulator [Spirochaetaceae bacterium]|nr:MAG: LacI family DNA-binding transcriptional regulator [Spirochaetaceae bacterium]